MTTEPDDAALRAALASGLPETPVPPGGLDAIRGRAARLRRQRRLGRAGATSAVALALFAVFVGRSDVSTDDVSSVSSSTTEAVATTVGPPTSAASSTTTSTTAPSDTTTTVVGDPASDRPGGATSPLEVPVVDDYPTGGGQLLYNGPGGIRAVFGNGTGDQLLAAGNDPTWAPDRSFLAFAGDGDGIFTVGPGGGPPQRLASGFTIKPEVSPTGTAVAFIDLTGARSDVVAVDLAGIELARSGLSTDGAFEWSPDGRYVAFQLATAGTSGSATDGVGVLDVTTGATTTVIEAPVVTAVGWTADGLVLAGTLDGDARIVTAPAAGGSLAVLATGYHQFVQSSSGRLLAQGDGSAAILRPDGSVVSQLPSSASSAAAAWSPDGQFVAVVSGSSDRFTLEIRSAGGGLVLSTATNSVALLGLVWSPDGSLVAGATTSDPLTTPLWTVRVTDGIARMIGGYRNGVCCSVGLDW